MYVTFPPYARFVQNFVRKVQETSKFNKHNKLIITGLKETAYRI